MNFLIIFAANYLIYILALVWLVSLIQIPKAKRRAYLVFLIIAFAFAAVGDKVLGMLYNNPRPFVVEGITPLVKHAADNGFPSGHTLFSMMFATTAFSFNRRLGIILAVLAVIVGFGRILAHVHHTIDIFGSIVLAIGVTYLAWVLVKKYFKKV